MDSVATASIPYRNQQWLAHLLFDVRPLSLFRNQILASLTLCGFFFQSRSGLRDEKLGGSETSARELADMASKGTSFCLAREFDVATAYDRV